MAAGISQAGIPVLQNCQSAALLLRTRSETSMPAVCVLSCCGRSGAALVARSYWDFGRCSDLWRSWRPLPTAAEGGAATLEACMKRTRTTEVPLLR